MISSEKEGRNQGFCLYWQGPPRGEDSKFASILQA